MAQHGQEDPIRWIWPKGTAQSGHLISSHLFQHLRARSGNTLSVLGASVWFSARKGCGKMIALSSSPIDELVGRSDCAVNLCALMGRPRR